MDREFLKSTDSIMDVATKLSMGNPGALTVICQVLERDREVGVLVLFGLDDMNIVADGIWIAHKYFCGMDIEKLCKAVFSRDPAMVDAVNNGGARHRAVTSGASFGQPSTSRGAE